MTIFMTISETDYTVWKFSWYLFSNSIVFWLWCSFSDLVAIWFSRCYEGSWTI